MIHILTTRFKVLLGVLAGIVAIGGLTANQALIQNRLNKLETTPRIVREIVVQPTASPSAAIIMTPTVAPRAGSIKVEISPTVVKMAPSGVK